MTDADTPTPRAVLPMTLLSILIGVVAAGVLWIVDELAGLLEDAWWHALPTAFGVDGDSPWWIFVILTVTGVLVGLVRWVVPGRGGIDTATVELAAPPQPLATVPSIAIASILVLAGGVSLGPEAPVIGIVVALVTWATVHRRPILPPEQAVMLGLAATIGALFGTPLAAALLLTSAFASAPAIGGAVSPLWDRLFQPLAAASAGALTTVLLGGGIGAVPGFEPYNPTLPDLLWGVVIAGVAALLGLAAAWGLPRLHHLLHRLRHPFLIPAVGGVLLGLLGALGGPLTLFKGLEQGAELVSMAGSVGAASIALILLVKLVALVVSAGATFPGGRVFPAVFLGMAAGMLGATLMPWVPLGYAVACGVLGMCLAITRDGWVAIFVAVAIIGDVGVLPLLCVVILPTWLIVRRGPEMIVHPVPAVAASDAPSGG